MENREDLLKEFNALSERLEAVKSQLNKIDFTERKVEALSYVGKTFKKIDTFPNESESVDLIHVHSYDLASGDFVCVELSYFVDLKNGTRTNYYTIQSPTTFNPLRFEEDKKSYIECTKDEFEAELYRLTHEIKTKCKINLS